jgi:hypothetical protein
MTVKKLRSLIGMIMMLSSVLHVAAQDLEPVGDVESAQRAGFRILPDFDDNVGMPSHDFIERQVVVPLANSVRAKPPYAFSYDTVKDDGDRVILFLRPRIYGYDPDRTTMGGPVVVALFERDRWVRQFVAGAFAVGIRKRGNAFDIALVREEGFREFRLDGKRFREFR